MVVSEFRLTRRPGKALSSGPHRTQAPLPGMCQCGLPHPLLSVGLLCLRLLPLGTRGVNLSGFDRMAPCVRTEPLSRVRLYVTPWTVAARLLCPWASPGKNAGVGCHFLLQGIFPTQGQSQVSCTGRQVLYP